jgi:hypothetical protein
VIVIDDGTGCTLYDAVLDGFPPIAPQDGTADFAGNALGIALQSGVTEERGIAELPLQPLTDLGLGSSDIDAATLTFNVDDVVSTFGPGTAFDGTAAETIVLFGYSGNGTIDLADFGNVVGAPLAVVDTTPFGVITDASLATSGPAGLNDWGGVSPLTPDHINPEKPWPGLRALREATEQPGFAFRERLAIYPEYATRAEFLDARLRPRVAALIDSDGLVRTEHEHWRRW